MESLGLPSLSLPSWLPAVAWCTHWAWKEVRDGLLLLGAVFTLNALLAPADPGWLELNPSPWLLVPAFLGARYGLRTGLAGALATAALLAIWQICALPNQADLLQRHPFFLISLVGMAGLAGAAQQMVLPRAEQAERERETLLHDLATTRQACRLLRLDRDALQDVLLKHQAVFASLPGDLERLFEAEAEASWGPALLDLFRKRFGVREAAIYRAGAKGGFCRVAHSGPAAAFPPELTPERASPVTQAALRSGQMVTCRHLWEETAGRPDDILAAFPALAAAKPETNCPPVAMLLIRRMDFDAIHWENLARVDALWQWTLCLATADQQPRAESRFERCYRLAAALDELVSLPFHLIRFEGTSCAPDTWEEFGRFLRGQLRKTDALSMTPARKGKAASAQILILAKDRVPPESLAANWLESWPHGAITWTVHPLRK